MEALGHAVKRLDARTVMSEVASIPESLVKLQGAAYKLAVRVLRGRDGAEDVVQQAFLALFKNPPPAMPPRELRTWFFRTVANTAKTHVRGEVRRKRREQDVTREQAVSVDEEVVAALRRAIEALDDEHRLAISLCYEQGLTQQEAASVLEVHQTTLSRHLAEGLERLRRMLATAGYRAAPAAMIGALAHTAPAVPATLAAAVEGILTGKKVGTGAVAASAAAKGGMAMKAILAVVLAGTVAAGAAGLSAFGFRQAEPRETGSGPAAAAPAVRTNPVAGRQDREEVFEFAQKPTVTKQGDKVVIAFASKGKCDATVAIVGPDGKVVRHLASGVLGANAPWPFQQNSLSQKVEWDGKDNRGRAAPAGCKVRVGLGLKAVHDKVFGADPRIHTATGMACDAEGTVYILKRDDDLPISAVDREGKYVRTVSPFPATVRAEDVPVERLAKLDDGRMSPVSSGTDCHMYALRGVSRQTMGLSPDGKTLFVVGAANRSPRYLLRLGTDGKGSREKDLVMLHEKRYSEGGIGGLLGRGDLHLAVSRDGEWLYFGSSASENEHVVYRKKVADVGKGPMVQGMSTYPPEVYLGELKKPGNDNAHFNSPLGVACDDAGNLYVADNGNGRIQVFDAAGKHARTIPFEGADQLQVHPKTGDIYVLGWGKGGHRLAKLDKEGKVVAQMPVKGLAANDCTLPTVFCLDWAAEEPAVWIVNGNDKRLNLGLLQRHVVRNGKFEMTVDVYKQAMESLGGWPLTPGMWGQPKIAADPEREEIYCLGIRADGRTGKILPAIEGLGGSEYHIGPDGLLYERRDHGQPRGGSVTRFDPATGKPVPFGDKKELPYDFCGGCRSFQDGFCVAPNGDIYLSLHEAEGSKIVPKLQAVGQGATMKAKPGWTHNMLLFLHVWGPDGTQKHVSAFPGMYTSCGIRVARNGNFYVAFNARPIGQKGPDGATDGDWGTLVAMDAALQEFKFPVGRIYGNDCPFKRGGGVAPEWPLKGEPMYRGRDGGDKMQIETVRWHYGGVTPVSTISGCICHNSRFDLDRFDRAWVPAMQTYTVNVLDSNGNLVVRVGGYGNADSRGKDSPVVDPKTGLLRPKRPTDPADLVPPKELSERPGFRMARYVAVTDEALYAMDQGNGRVVRCTIGYHAEETVGLDGSSASAVPAAPAASAAPVTAPAVPGHAAAAQPSPPASATDGHEAKARGLLSLALSYRRSGMEDKAQEHLARVIKEHPHSVAANHARRELARN